ncbi:uncharacterized protein EDB91DRAFT_1314356 [Suillus paluster]|uniref:uncharacterized protein n=1 Tax=Suillus paluster TaxID=48578 RepID=UPI001B884DA9|nr:uncharacterized protein EDB91DRAFT_1314356 [Suillus paluster]KAG1728179.1 hypothetical protein EDB91DRAFT_1314356 [Suillus paluster]
MAEAAQPIIPSTEFIRRYEGHKGSVLAVAVPDKRSMVTGSKDKMLHLWDMNSGVVVKKLKGHTDWVRALAVSQDGLLIASSDWSGKVLAWHGDTGESITTRAIAAHSTYINSLEFSPDRVVLASGSFDKTTKLWSTKTWRLEGNLNCGDEVNCIRYSPSGEHLAIATTKNIQIWEPDTKKCIATFEAHAVVNHAYNMSLAWTSDSTRLLSAGNGSDPTIREWDPLTWQQPPHPVMITSASGGSRIDEPSPYSNHSRVNCIAFSMNSKHIFSGGGDDRVSQWLVPSVSPVPLVQSEKGGTNISPRDAEEQASDRDTPYNNNVILSERPVKMDQGSLNLKIKVTKAIERVSSRSSNERQIQKEGKDTTIGLPKTNEKASKENAPCKSREAPKASFPDGSTGKSPVMSPRLQSSPAFYLAHKQERGILYNIRGKSENTPFKQALLDAQKAIDHNPSSYHGYELKHAALHGARRYDEAIDAFSTMLSKLNYASDVQIRSLREQYFSVSDAERAIRQAIDAQLDNAPLRLLNTSNLRLYDQEGQIDTFKASTEYKELISLTMKHADLRTERINETVAMYFRCVMLSHRWEGKEPLLQDIQNKVVHEPRSGIVKLQSFCKIACNAGYRWAWMDTCCIDKSNHVELQQSLNSMFVWYHHSALTIVYLSDVSPSSKPGALAKSAWNNRGWTVPEFLAPKTILFYQKDWTLYLDDRSPNHKQSPAIMQELADSTGIDPGALVAFHPGMRGAREKLQWASRRVTTRQEDIAYSLFGVFGVRLHVDYGEKKDKAARAALAGDKFNSCLPADITSYTAPPRTLPSLSEDMIQSSVSLLRGAVSVESASNLHSELESLSAPRFANCRLHLPCIVFRVTDVRRLASRNQETASTYSVKAEGLHAIQITTEDKLIQFSRARPIQQTFLLVRPWDRFLIEQPDFSEQPDFADDVQSENHYWDTPESPLPDSPTGSLDSEFHSRMLRLIVRLGQPFSALLLAQQRGREYKRIASDQGISCTS